MWFDIIIRVMDYRRAKSSEMASRTKLLLKRGPSDDACFEVDIQESDFKSSQNNKEDTKAVDVADSINQAFLKARQNRLKLSQLEQSSPLKETENAHTTVEPEQKAEFQNFKSLKQNVDVSPINEERENTVSDKVFNETQDKPFMLSQEEAIKVTNNQIKNEQLFFRSNKTQIQQAQRIHQEVVQRLVTPQQNDSESPIKQEPSFASNQPWVRAHSRESTMRGAAWAKQNLKQNQLMPNSTSLSSFSRQQLQSRGKMSEQQTQVDSEAFLRRSSAAHGGNAAPSFDVGTNDGVSVDFTNRSRNSIAFNNRASQSYFNNVVSSGNKNQLYQLCNAPVNSYQNINGQRSTSKAAPVQDNQQNTFGNLRPNRLIQTNRRPLTTGRSFQNFPNTTTNKKLSLNLSSNQTAMPIRGGLLSPQYGKRSRPLIYVPPEGRSESDTDFIIAVDEKRSLTSELPDLQIQQSSQRKFALPLQKVQNLGHVPEMSQEVTPRVEKPVVRRKQSVAQIVRQTERLKVQMLQRQQATQQNSPPLEDQLESQVKTLKKGYKARKLFQIIQGSQQRNTALLTKMNVKSPRQKVIKQSPRVQPSDSNVLGINLQDSEKQVNIRIDDTGVPPEGYIFKPSPRYLLLQKKSKKKKVPAMNKHMTQQYKQKLKRTTFQNSSFGPKSKQSATNSSQPSQVLGTNVNVTHSSSEQAFNLEERPVIASPKALVEGEDEQMPNQPYRKATDMTEQIRTESPVQHESPPKFVNQDIFNELEAQSRLDDTKQSTPYLPSKQSEEHDIYANSGQTTQKQSPAPSPTQPEVSGPEAFRRLTQQSPRKSSISSPKRTARHDSCVSSRQASPRSRVSTMQMQVNSQKSTPRRKTMKSPRNKQINSPLNKSPRRTTQRSPRRTPLFEIPEPGQKQFEIVPMRDQSELHAQIKNLKAQLEQKQKLIEQHQSRIHHQEQRYSSELEIMRQYQSKLSQQLVKEKIDIANQEMQAYFDSKHAFIKTQAQRQNESSHKKKVQQLENKFNKMLSESFEISSLESSLNVLEMGDSSVSVDILKQYKDDFQKTRSPEAELDMGSQGIFDKLDSLADQNHSATQMSKKDGQLVSLQKTAKKSKQGSQKSSPRKSRSLQLSSSKSQPSRKITGSIEVPSDPASSKQGEQKSKPAPQLHKSSQSVMIERAQASKTFEKVFGKTKCQSQRESSDFVVPERFYFEKPQRLTPPIQSIASQAVEENKQSDSQSVSKKSLKDKIRGFFFNPNRSGLSDSELSKLKRVVNPSK